MRETRSCSDNCLLNVSTVTRYVLLTSVYDDYTQRQAFYTDKRRFTRVKINAYKTQSTAQPKYLNQLISSQLTGSTMSLRSSTRPLLQVPCTKTVYSSRAFSSAVPAIWNNLPSAVLEANSLPAFRRQLKTHLFTVAYTDSWVASCSVASASVSVLIV